MNCYAVEQKQITWEALLINITRNQTKCVWHNDCLLERERESEGV